ncbi:tubulin-binding cofactor C [Lycorma delicatula]|uniref:tubulin-binding cofactor C n=1 Tax=Lycorma delicatula TaxID=130591 RepID=UPI003F510583
MDECAEENLKHLPKSLIKRHVELQQQLDKQKEEKLELGSAQQQVNYFLDAFGKKACEINETIELLRNGLVIKENLPEYFDKLSKELQNLNRFLSTSTSYLRVYDIRKCKQTLEEMQICCQELEEKLLPKKKFGFKAKKYKVLNQNSVEKKCNDEVDGELMKNVWWKDKINLNNCGFYNRSGEFLKLNASDVDGKDVEISLLHDCTVVLFGTPSTLHVTNTDKCKIFSGPVSTSVFVENCNDCTLVFPCQQLRVHTTRNTKFYIHVTSRAIIEDSDQVQFAPFNWHYEGIKEHFKHAGLDTDRNNWNLVDDFNWLALDVPSPNWKIIDASERVQDWSLNLQDLKN